MDDPRLRGVVVPHPFDLDEFRLNLARQRGRPLYLHDLPAEATALTATGGIWLPTAMDDHIFIPCDLVDVARDRVTLRHIGHMVYEHRTVVADGFDLLLAHGLTAYDYSAEQIAEAEAFAAHILAVANS
ncbi:hypothetical protein AB0M47_26285 [Hamadaea sp. NPDC051192]|uniref:hypothetical protein n=1 Tax=Hamadaea sp. NPDC051192 TaxID=3154940 RepID=UPI00341FED5D